MTKNTQILLGVAAVAAVGFYLYNQQSRKKSFVRRATRLTTEGDFSSGAGLPVKSCSISGYQSDGSGGAKFVMVGNTAYYPCCDPNMQAIAPPSDKSLIKC